MKGNSSLTDLTVGKGSVVNMTADSGRYCSLQVDNLTAADGTFVMNAGAVDGGGSYSDKRLLIKILRPALMLLKSFRLAGWRLRQETMRFW